jgi:photoactive yellow protein
MTYDLPDLLLMLNQMEASALDDLQFGVIHFNDEFMVERYNRYEQIATGVRPERVIGNHVFTQVAQCMNNYLVAQRFEDAMATGTVLDDALPYVLTWKMRPTRVTLRLLWSPASYGGYVIIQRAD